MSTYELIFVFCLGILCGVLIHMAVVRKFRDYSGTIEVSKDGFRDKTVYSLVLDEYPEKLEFKKVVRFRVVDTSGKSSDRK
jgi:hypothetical protein